MKNLLLTIEYDGTHFSGWQRQPKARTVQGELERVLSEICREEITLHGTSRTDAGVHALGQRASFTGNFGIPTDRIGRAANNVLGATADGLRNRGKAGDIYIKKVEEVPMGFHARFDAVGKKYIYLIENTEQVDIFYRNYRYGVTGNLDLDKMRRAAEDMVGTHDFKCFQAAGGKEMETTVRTIHSLEIQEEQTREKDRGKTIRVEVTGDGFLYNMVRIMTGTLIDVGKGKIPEKAVREIIESRDRQRAGHTAPPQGLYLAEVYYDRDRVGERKEEKDED